jgi:hypothetical protein
MKEKVTGADKVERIANLILGGGFVSCIVLLLYVVYQYGWTGDREFSSPVGILVYYGVPAALATLFFGFLQLQRDYKINLAVVSVSTALSMYGAEVFLTFWSSAVSPPRPLMAPSTVRNQREKDAVVELVKQSGVEFDTRSKLEFITDLRRQGIDAVTNVFPRNLLKEHEGALLRSAIRIHGTEVLPLAGISNKLTVLCNETGTYTTYQSDEHGFHNPLGIWKIDHIDVAVVGDSFAHGACVPSDRNFVALIRKHYPATLNLGIAGNGPLLELASLKEYLPRFTPKVVLWFYFEENDLGELKNEMNSPLLLSYAKGAFKQHLFERQSDIDKALKDYVQEEERLELKKKESENQKRSLIDFYLVENIIKLSTLRQKIGLVYGQADLDIGSRVGVVELDLLREILSQAKASTQAWNGKLYFVYLPEWNRYGGPQLASKNREPVLRLAQSLDIPVIDLHPAFQAHGDPLSLFPFRRFFHYNEQGHRLVAETVLRSLSTTSGLPASDSEP